VLLYITLFLITLIILTIAVWGYRSVDNRQGFKQNAMGNPVTATRPILKAQQGFISLSRESAKHKTLPSPKGGYKAPWGW
jgi:hypothetical protein